MTRVSDDRPVAIEGVLFDMDGTLSDTEPFWFEAEQLIVTRYGTGPVTDRAAHRVGASMDADAAFLQEHYGVSLSTSEIRRLTVDHVLSRLAEGVNWRPGARELLAEARALGIPTALVTTSPRAIAGAVIRALPAGSFGVIITEEDVTNPKPDPEPYLSAAYRLNVDPRRCIAIEDSLNGTLSAQRAGCFVVAVSSDAAIDDAARRVSVPSLSGISLQQLSSMYVP